MNTKTILALLGRKSLTWISGFCACAWAVCEWPDAFDNPKLLLGIASAALLAVSGAESYRKDKEAGKTP